MKYSTQPWKTHLKKEVILKISDDNFMCRRMRGTSLRDAEGSFEDIPLAKTTYEKR